MIDTSKNEEPLNEYEKEIENSIINAHEGVKRGAKFNFFNTMTPDAIKTKIFGLNDSIALERLDDEMKRRVIVRDTIRLKKHLENLSGVDKTYTAPEELEMVDRVAAGDVAMKMKLLSELLISPFNKSINNMQTTAEKRSVDLLDKIDTGFSKIDTGFNKIDTGFLKLDSFLDAAKSALQRVDRAILSFDQAVKTVDGGVEHRHKHSIEYLLPLVFIILLFILILYAVQFLPSFGKNSTTKVKQLKIKQMSKNKKRKKN